MVDHVQASIEIGGVIEAAAYADLVAAAESEGLSLEWDGEPFAADQRAEGETLKLYANEVAWGRFDRLEALCVAKGLPFARWSGGLGGCWGAERLVFTGAGEPDCYEVNEEDRVLIDRHLVKDLGSVDAIIAYFDAADFKVPPLVIEG